MKKKSLALGMILPMAAAGAVATAPAASANTYNHGSNHWNRVSCRLEANTLHREVSWRGSDRVRLEFKLDTNNDRGRWVVVFKKHYRVVEVAGPRRTYHGDLNVVEYVRSGPGWYSATAYNINTGQRCSDSDEARPARRPVLHPVLHPVFHGGHAPVVVVPVRPVHH